MKKILNLGLFVLIVAAMIGCSGSSETPGDAAKKYAGYLGDGQYEKFIDALAMPEGIAPEEFKEQKSMLLSALKEKGKTELEGRGKMKKIDIVSETVSTDGEHATVVLDIAYANEETEEMTFDLVKQSGKWKIVLDK